MIAFIKGTIAAIGSDWLVIENDGIGWQIAYPHCDQVHLKQEVQIYTYLNYSDVDLSLYGFESNEEKELFQRLISVKGLGPKTAMGMLAKAGREKIISAVETGDVSALKKVPGIGAKTASQIVLDLKGKLVPVAPADSKAAGAAAYPVEIEDALQGLRNLGYKGSELSDAAAYLGSLGTKTTGEYLKAGLQYLNKKRTGGM